MKRVHPRAWLLLTLTLLVALLSWWSVLLHRLAAESYEQSVTFYGVEAEATQRLERRKTMIAGESAALIAATIVLLGLGWRSTVVEARQAERLRVLFAASTHELKTPIAGVRALLESLQSGVLPLEAAGPHLARGLDACDRLQRLAEGMLVRQAVLAGESPQETRTLAEWLAPVMERRSLHPQEAVAVELGEAATCRLVLPGEALRVIVDNLLDNATKYAPGRAIRLTARREGAKVLVEVEDQGNGFAPEDAERLFEPWDRGRRAGSAHGTGLGLYLARSIAREAGGDLRASSAGAGRGATFRLTLPASEGS